MKLSEANFIFTVKIKLDEVLSNVKFKDQYIVMREPEDWELSKVQNNGDNESKASQLRKLFTSCIIETSFTDDDEKPSNPKDVADFICKSASTYTKIEEYWLKSCPFPSVKENSEN